MPYEITISGINTTFNKCIEWVTCKVDTPATSNARSNYVGNYMNISGFIGTDEVTIDLYQWSILPVNDSNVCRSLQLTIKDANDNIIEKISFPNAFVQYYKESYARDKGLGKFNLQLKQRIDKNRDINVSASSVPEVLENESKSKIVENILGKVSKNDILDTVRKPEIKLGKDDLDKYRKELKVPETNTIAVGKTDIKGLEDLTFKGGSPDVRKEAGLPNINDIYPERTFKAPYNDVEFPKEYGQFTRHAEEGVLNQFDEAVTNAGLDPKQIEGTLRIHQSNPRGVCNKCTKGLLSQQQDANCGIFYQASKRYPNVTFDVTSEMNPKVKLNGISSFVLKGGILTKR